MIEYIDIMKRADSHYHDPAQFHLTEFDTDAGGGCDE